MHGIRWWVSLAWLVLACPAHAAAISGTYVGTVTNVAVLVQVVQTNDGKLTGRWEHKVLLPTGKMEAVTAQITGASDGTTVVITLTPVDVLGATLTLSGTVEGTSLHLNGSINGASGAFDLTKSTDAAYRLQVAVLADRSQKIIEQQARWEAIDRVVKLQSDLLAKAPVLSRRVAAFSSDTNAAIGRFAEINLRYKSITELMLSAHGRQAAIFGGGQASVARGQIGGAINQAAGEANQFHMSVESSYQEIRSKIGALAGELSEATNTCQSLGISSPTKADIQVGCSNLIESAKTLQQRADALQRAFVDSERTWNEERRKQEGVVRAADQASR